MVGASGTSGRRRSGLLSEGAGQLHHHPQFSISCRTSSGRAFHHCRTALMRKAWVVLLFLTALGRAQLTAPRIGFVSDRDGALRPVMGVSGTFLLGDPV